jgi:hypothetical protein
LSSAFSFTQWDETNLSILASNTSIELLNFPEETGVLCNLFDILFTSLFLGGFLNTFLIVVKFTESVVPYEVIDECFCTNTTLIKQTNGGKRVEWYCELNKCCKELRAGNSQKLDTTTINKNNKKKQKTKNKMQTTNRNASEEQCTTPHHEK